MNLHAARFIFANPGSLPLRISAAKSLLGRNPSDAIRVAYSIQETRAFFEVLADDGKLTTEARSYLGTALHPTPLVTIAALPIEEG